MMKNKIIKLQTVFLSVAIISAEIAVYLWKPSTITLLMIVVVNALGMVGALELLNPKI